MGWFIVKQLFIANNIAAQWLAFKQSIQGGNLYLLVLAIALMPVNWLLETVKWQVLIKSKEPFINLFKSVLAGTTMGFVTPARAGEFVGRVLFVAEENKARIFYLSSIGGIAQSVATLLAGMYFVWLWTDNTLLNGITAGIAMAFTVVYFRFDILNGFISQSAFLQKHSLTINPAELPTLREQGLVLGLSLVRFGVYLSQYVLLLMLMGISSNYFVLAVHSGVFLVAQTFSPVMPFIDISYRGGSALYVFGKLTGNNLGVLTAVMLVWFINLVVPSLLGYVFIAQHSNAGKQINKL
ncbi:MAG: hypothetical protein RLZZ367_220 [Bacteroidota bacterium]